MIGCKTSYNRHAFVPCRHPAPVRSQMASSALVDTRMSSTEIVQQVVNCKFEWGSETDHLYQAEIRSTGEGQFGLFAEQDIEPGAVIVLSKALYALQASTHAKATSEALAGRKRISKRARLAAGKSVEADELAKFMDTLSSPDAAPTVSLLQRLYAGTDYPRKDPVTGVDVFAADSEGLDEPSVRKRTAKVFEFNGAGPSSVVKSWLLRESRSLEPPKTTGRRGKVLPRVPIGSSAKEQRPGTVPPGEVDADVESKDAIQSDKVFQGLWYGFSFLNHSCLPNCSWHAVDEVMVVVTSQHVSADEELTIGYTDTAAPWKDRAARLKTFGFACRCRMCEEERSVQSTADQRNVREVFEHWHLACEPHCSEVLDASMKSGEVIPKVKARSLEQDLQDLIQVLDTCKSTAAKLIGADVLSSLGCVLFVAGEERRGLVQMEAAFVRCFEENCGDSLPGSAEWSIPGAPRNPLAATIATQVALTRSLNALGSRKGVVQKELECAARWLAYAVELRYRVSGLSELALEGSFTAEELTVFRELKAALAK